MNLEDCNFGQPLLRWIYRRPKLYNIRSYLAFAMSTFSHTAPPLVNGALPASSRNISVVGRQHNFWLFSNRDGFDLTHPDTPSSPPVQPRIKLGTTTDPITIAPQKTALVIIDMQNFFLSKALGRERGEGHAAEETLLKYGIPAARKAGIQIIWLTWGITEKDLETLPPTIWRIFGWTTSADGEFEVEDEVLGSASYVNGMQQQVAGKVSSEKFKRKEKKTGGGIGQEIGDITLEDGTVTSAGRLLMRDQWNTRLHPPLEAAYQDGLKAKIPDVRFHKARLSGMWGSDTAVQDFLGKRSIRTLLFAGVNSDQCVLATLQDACNQGWDTILLKDGCGTTSPDFARKTVLYNCEKSWGFTSTCEDLAKGIQDMNSPQTVK